MTRPEVLLPVALIASVTFAFSTGYMVGARRTARRLVQHLNDNPRDLIGWADAIRKAELESADGA